MSDDATEHKNESVVLESSFLDPNLPLKTSGDGDADGDADPNLDLDPVLIILNHNLPRLTASLWRRARLVVVADGGADRLLEASRGWEESFGPAFCSSSSSWRRRRQLSDDGDGGGGDNDNDDNGKPSSPPSSPSFLPDFIVGDLDSISGEARLHFGALGVPIVDLSPDHDSTDLQKCLGCAAAEVERQRQRQQQQERQRRRQEEPSAPQQPSSSSSSSSAPSSSLPAPPVFVAGALGGRLDHSLSAISTLYAIDAARRSRKEKEAKGGGGGYAAAAARSLGEIVLSGDGSLARLIPSPSSSSETTTTTVTTKILPCAAVEGPGCGLVALGAPAEGVETSGLKWNLERAAASATPAGEGQKKGSSLPVLEMGGLQSTSNSVVEREVTVTASAPLLWTTTLREEWR